MSDRGIVIALAPLPAVRAGSSAAESEMSHLPTWCRPNRFVLRAASLGVI